MDDLDTQHWHVVRRSDGTPDMYVVAYGQGDADRYLPLLAGELSLGKTIEPVGDAALLARLSGAVDTEDLDGVWVTDIEHAWRAETGFAHGHN